MSDNSHVRVSIVGVVIVALFASLVARLWFLQMGPERALGQEAVHLQQRVIQTESTRGEILDRNGKVLAQDRAAWAVTVDRNLNKKTRARVMGQLSELLGVPEPTLLANYTSKRQTPLLPAVVAFDIKVEQRVAVQEHQDIYPGVRVEELTVRTYPTAAHYKDDGLAAQALGYVGEIGADQLKQLKSRGYQVGDLIGRDGVEAAYESVLRGRPKRVTVQVDPRGQQIGPPVSVDPGSVGKNVYLTIDSRVQYVAEQALQDGINAARTQPEDPKFPGGPRLKAPAGAVVVLDAQDGSVVAMASNPTYPLSWWVGGMTQANFAALNNPAANNPLLNRATEGLYAPGSAFKLVSALAMTRYGIRGAYFTYNDTGSVTIGGPPPIFNDNHAVNGPVALQRAITVSSDTYFYTVGGKFWQTWNGGDETNGLGLQTEARDLGFGSVTGIELSEGTGRVPDPTWKKKFANILYSDQKLKDANSIWYPGDEVSLAVGQKDVVVTPLQLADAYACFANDGTLLTPHIGMRIEDPASKRFTTINPKPRGHVSFDETTRGQMQLGFAGVVGDKAGTAYNAFQGFPLNQTPVAGKTGTAQVAGKGPTSVFASYFTVNGRQYVAVALVEQGGHGADIAAPIVRRVIESMLHPQAAAQPIAPITPSGSGKD